MIRYLLFAFLFYILFIVVTRVLQVFIGFMRRAQNPPPAANQPQPSKPIQEYTDVADAKFKDVDLRSKPGEGREYERSS